MRSILVTLMLLTISSVAAAQDVDTAWVRTFSNESATAVGVTKMDLDSADNPILIGWITTVASASDFMVLKYFASGDTAWARTFDFAERGNDRATAISISFQQALAISGNCNQDDYHSSYAATIVLSSDGAPLDTVYHPMKTVIWNHPDFVWFTSLGVANLIVVGERHAPLKMHMTILDSLELVTELDNFDPLAVVLGAGHTQFYVAGSSGTSVSTTYSTAAIAESDLDTNWLRSDSRSTVASLMSPTAIASFGDDGVVVTGRYRNMTWTSTFQEIHWVTYRYNSLGTRLWTGEYTTCWGIPKAICTDRFGNTIITGQTQASYACAHWVPDTNQILILKYDSGGELIWDVQHIAPGMTTYDVVASAVDAQSNLYLVANVLGDVAGTDNDILVMRVNSGGEIDWSYTYASASGERDLANAMRLDRLGNLYIAGTTGGDKALLIKLVQSSFVDVDDSETPVVPAAFELSQNFPNPFNPSTEFWYTLTAPTHAIVEIFSINGALVRKLVDDDLQAGSHRVTWDGRAASGRRVASGVYFYRLRAAGQSASKKMTLIK